MLFSNSVFCIVFVDSAKTKEFFSAGPGHGFRTLWQSKYCSSFDKGTGIRKTKQKKNKKRTICQAVGQKN